MKDDNNNFPAKKWINKGLSIVLILTLLSSGLIMFNSTKHHGLPDLRGFNYWALGGTCLILIISWLIEALRIRLIVKGLGENISFSKMLGINLVTLFTGNITPFCSGGIPTQIYLLCQAGIQAGKASAIVTLRVIISTLLFTIFSPFLLIFFYKQLPLGLIRQIIGIAIPLAALFSLILIMVIIKPELINHLLKQIFKSISRFKLATKLEPLITKIITELEIFRDSIQQFRNGLYFYLLILCSAGYWFAFFAIAPCLLLAFGVPYDPNTFMQTIIFQFLLVFLISYLPIPGGSGAMEFGLYSVLVFVPLQLRAIFILSWRFFSYYLSTFVGGIILLRILHHSRSNAETPN